MLLVNEVLRVLGQTLRYALATRRVGIVVVIALTAVAVLLSFTVVKVAPVVFYPFL